MRRTGWTPSIVPNGHDQTDYLVVGDFGRKGRAHRETDVEAADLETVIVNLLDGQYSNPIRVVAFNTFEGWSQDVSADIAQEVRRRCDRQLRDVPSSIPDFVQRHDGPIEFAHIGTLRAIDRHVSRMFDPSRERRNGDAASWHGTDDSIHL
jgi:hypothetical protein